MPVKDVEVCVTVLNMFGLGLWFIEIYVQQEPVIIVIIIIIIIIIIYYYYYYYYYYYFPYLQRCYLSRIDGGADNDNLCFYKMGCMSKSVSNHSVCLFV